MYNCHNFALIRTIKSNFAVYVLHACTNAWLLPVFACSVLLQARYRPIGFTEENLNAIFFVMENYYYGFVQPKQNDYFADKIPGTPERFHSLNSLDENEFVIRFMSMLQDQRMTREDHQWW